MSSKRRVSQYFPRDFFRLWRQGWSRRNVSRERRRRGSSDRWGRNRNRGWRRWHRCGRNCQRGGARTGGALLFRFLDRRFDLGQPLLSLQLRLRLQTLLSIWLGWRGGSRGCRNRGRGRRGNRGLSHRPGPAGIKRFKGRFFLNFSLAGRYDRGLNRAEGIIRLLLCLLGGISGFSSGFGQLDDFLLAGASAQSCGELGFVRRGDFQQFVGLESFRGRVFLGLCDGFGGGFGLGGRLVGSRLPGCHFRFRGLGGVLGGARGREQTENQSPIHHQHAFSSLHKV